MGLPGSGAGFFMGQAMVADEKSVSIQSASTEWLRSAASTLGIVNDFSIMIPFKAITNPVAVETLVEFGEGSTDPNNLQLWHRPSNLQFFLGNSAGTIFKNLRWADSSAENTWQTWVFTFNGTTGDIVLGYKDGSLQTIDTTTTDDAGTMTDTSRKIHMGVARDNSQNVTSTAIHSFAMWSSVLGATEITEIYNSGNVGGFDLEADSGNYSSSANLVHWFKLGNDEADIGGDTVGSIDLMASNSNISAADIIADAPS